MSTEQTAMLLTGEEWDDLAYIAETFRLNFDRLPWSADEETRRRLALVTRFHEATGYKTSA